MRDRLIELIRDAKDEYPTVPTINCCKAEFANFLADRLLENGVIVPPCKVGDVVYRTYDNYCGEEIYEGAVDQIFVSRNRKVRLYVHGHPLGFTPDDIGKTVFLTREEAEQALKGENHDG